jgi:hypothetical protein
VSGRDRGLFGDCAVRRLERVLMSLLWVLLVIVFVLLIVFLARRV